jgi:predicted MFS family arabinose efflux permease
VPRHCSDDDGMTSTTVPAPRTTYRSVFAVGEFRVLFAGMLMYCLGFEFEILGLSVIIYAQTRSPLLTALAFSMGFAPQVVGGALFTSLADRLPPRAVITGGLLLRAVPGLVIGLWPGLPVAVMLALVAAAAMTSPVYSAALSGLLPDVLDGDRYVLGRSILSLTSAGTQILGLGAAGAILLVLPARRLLLLAGCSLVLSALIRRGLRPRPARAGRAGAGRASGGAMRGGMRGAVRATLRGNARLLADPRIRGLLIAQWLPAALVTGADSQIVPYTTGSLGLPSSAASLMLAAMPAGMLLGDVIVGRFCQPATRERLAFPLILLLGTPLLAFAFRPPLLAAVVAEFVAGCGFGYLLGIQRAFLDSVPEELRGQAFGLNSTGLMSGQGLLPPVAGALALAVTPAGAIALSGAATILAALALRRPLSAARTPAVRIPAVGISALGNREH